ncbi:helix-turn-helix domain-containing protein [Eubacteriales bacterium OttesenSCG-928-A19]|nr:helix-turn-helix domain-containing protein [Eubacteriales bacterium OttesenSCG-928-A19]
MNDLQSKLKSLREIGFPYAVIARYAGVDTSVISRIANGKANTTPATTAKIEDAMRLIWEMVDAVLGCDNKAT